MTLRRLAVHSLSLSLSHTPSLPPSPLTRCDSEASIFRPVSLLPAMPPKPSDASAGQLLGSREQSVFKQLVRFYETKQYKKALKAADAILKKHASHGETLAMKGLVYNQLKRRDDAHSLVKKGLEANFNSHVCWHVYGLIYRAENKYEQAIKCFDERTQLLTFDGRRFAWMGLDDIRAHQHHQRHHHPQQQLLVASYNPHTEQLDYQPLSQPLLIKHGQHTMVDLRHAAVQSNGVELSVTDEHTLFVRRGRGSDSSAGSSSGSDSSGRSDTVSGCWSDTMFSRVEARELLRMPGSSVVQLLAAAGRGANTSTLPKPRAAWRTTGQTDTHLH